MKIIYIHQYFKTPKESGGTRSYWIATELVKKGHEVVVITSKNGMGVSVKKEIINNIVVIYLNVPYSNNMGFITRLRAFIIFMFKSSYYTFKEQRTNLVFATSTPLTVGVPALLVKWFKKIPFVFEVRDLWPEVPIQMGALNNPFLKRSALFLEKIIYKNSSHIVALSPGMREGVLRYVNNQKKVSLIPNMSKIDIFFPREVSKEEKHAMGLNSDKFNCIHFGTMGIANGLDYIILAAQYAKVNSINSIDFIFLGEGSEESKLKQMVYENNLNNVKFLGSKALNEVSMIVNACDLSIVSFANIDILKTNSPNKLFDSLSAGKPIIVNSAGWTKRMVEEYNCGFFANPLIPEDLIRQIQILESDIDLRKDFSKNSRLLAKNVYDKSILIPELVEILENIK